MANAMLETRSTLGHSQRMRLNISSFQTGLELQMNSAQLQTGVVHRPVRRQEQYLTFTVDWSLQRYAEMDHFMDHLRQHFRYSLAVPSRMTFYYLPIKRSWEGIIDGVQRSAERFTPMYSRTYRMRLFEHDVRRSRFPVPPISSFTPVAADIDRTNDTLGGWYNFEQGQIAAPRRSILGGVME